MTEGPLIIEPPIERAQRVDGWVLLGLNLLVWPSLVWMAMAARTHLGLEIHTAEDFLQVILGLPLGLIFCGAVTVWGARAALETQKWVLGPDYFECQSRLLGFRWKKIYRARAWKFEILHPGADLCHHLYSLRPTAPQWRFALMPLFRSSDGYVTLELGRQLAHATGWPLQLPCDLERLEKEIQT